MTTAGATLVKSKIDKFRYLPADWNGADTVLPSDTCISAALALIDALEAADLSLPHPSPSYEGEIGLTWYVKRNVFDLNLDSDSHAVWVTRINKQVAEGKDLLFSSNWIEQVIEALQVFYRKVKENAVSGVDTVLS